MSETQIKIPDKLTILAKPKRFKVVIGGRGGGKSESVAALFAGMVHQSGCRAVCCREYQTSIRQSVHSLVSRKIRELELEGFSILQAEITHSNGGDIVYQGLARDPQAIKSIDDAELCWVEEAQSLSEDSLEELTPSIRGAGSEVWFTANLGRSTDPFSKKFIKPFEKQLRANNGIYEDDLHTIVWINYDENPFFPPELEAERQRDEEVMSTAGYAHKWLGEFADTVDNAMIKPEWFDACVDAHVKLGFEALGIEVVSHDPSDEGSDSKGLAYRHGVVFLDVQEKMDGDINEGGDWASDYCHEVKPDIFIWDGDGMGVGLRRQFNEALGPKKIQLEMFRGSSAVDRPDDIYEDGTDQNKKTNKQTFKNKRAQYGWQLRDRVYKTFLAVTKGKYIDPDELVSFSSKIKAIDLLRSEVCSVALKPNGMGLIQLLSKDEARKLGIESPNMFDSVMMSWAVPSAETEYSDYEDTPYHGSSGWMA